MGYKEIMGKIKTEIGELGEKQVRVDTDTVKCSSCGSNMVFDPEKQLLYCEHCGNTVKFDSENAKEIELSSAFGKDEKWNEEENVVFRCDNCGAKVVLQKGETAKSCPFCGTAHVTKVEELSGLKPNGVIPFKFNSEKAEEYAKTWAKKRIFAPRKFKKNIIADKLGGVYTPCFTFDSHTTSIYKGRIGKHYTRVVGSGKNRRTETYTVWKNISGTYYDNFDDVLITAGSKFDQKKLEKIEPYDTNSGKEFSEKFLLGFMAYHYDKELTDCWGSAKDKMDAQIRKGILRQYSYDVVDYLNVSTTHERVTYKYVMLPVYVGNYTYGKKLYNFYVNGESGKTHGKTPLSPWRILVAVTLGLAAVAGIVYLILQYVH